MRRDGMKDFFKKLPEQAVRVVVVFVVLAAGVFVVRQFIIPPEMKEMTLIQTATMEREADKEIKYAGDTFFVVPTSEILCTVNYAAEV